MEKAVRQKDSGERVNTAALGYVSNRGFAYDPTDASGTLCGLFLAPVVSPARGPQPDSGELVHAHDYRHIFDRSPDEPSVADIRSR